MRDIEYSGVVEPPITANGTTAIPVASETLYRSYRNQRTVEAEFANERFPTSNILLYGGGIKTGYEEY